MRKAKKRRKLNTKAITLASSVSYFGFVLTIEYHSNDTGAVKRGKEAISG